MLESNIKFSPDPGAVALMKRLAEEGPALGDRVGMEAIINDLVEADPSFVAFIVQEYGREFTSGWLSGLTVGYYLLRAATTKSGEA